MIIGKEGDLECEGKIVKSWTFWPPVALFGALRISDCFGNIGGSSSENLTQLRKVHYGREVQLE
jgi:hypothetical protein